MNVVCLDANGDKKSGSPRTRRAERQEDQNTEGPKFLYSSGNTETQDEGRGGTRGRARAKEDVRGRRFFLLFLLFLFPPFFCMTSHLVATQLMVAFLRAESCPRRSARPRNSPTSLISRCSLLATFASSFSTSFAGNACERRKETEAALPVEAASVPVGRSPAREPPLPCPPASSPLLPRPDQHCGDGQRRGLRRRSAVRGATTNAGVAHAAAWRLQCERHQPCHPLGSCLHGHTQKKRV